MPLAYDDIPGSWGTQSEGWPAFVCRSEEHAARVFAACVGGAVPYGSYVKVGMSVRVETQELLEKLRERMFQAAQESKDEAIRKYETEQSERRKYT